MKNRSMILRIVLIAVVFALFSWSCVSIPVEETRGELVITNIPSEYESMYIVAFTNLNTDTFIYAADNISTKGRITPSSIKNGKATLNVWQGSKKGGVSNYNGVYSRKKAPVVQQIRSTCP